MKKLIVVLCILVVILGAGITEIIISNRLFEKMHDGLVRVEESMQKNPKNFDNPDTIEKIDEVLELWEKSRTYLYAFNSHIIMHSLNEKLVTLKKQIEINAEQDAPVTISITISCVHELMDDCHPKFINIF